MHTGMNEAAVSIGKIDFLHDEPHGDDETVIWGYIADLTVDNPMEISKTLLTMMNRAARDLDGTFAGVKHVPDTPQVNFMLVLERTDDPEAITATKLRFKQRLNERIQQYMSESNDPDRIKKAMATYSPTGIDDRLQLR